jgi:hypothetical protein
MKKIAIRGNYENGLKIIELLESLGGINRWNFVGQRLNCYYYINIDNNIDNDDLDFSQKQEYKLYETLEEYEKELNKFINYQDI